MDENCSSKSRREFLSICSAAGVGSTFFAGTLHALAIASPETKVTVEMIDQAAALAGISLAPDKRTALLSKINEQRRAYGAIRRPHLPNYVPPAFHFDPVTSNHFVPSESAPVRIATTAGNPPAIVKS